MNCVLLEAWTPIRVAPAITGDESSTTTAVGRG